MANIEIQKTVLNRDKSKKVLNSAFTSFGVAPEVQSDRIADFFIEYENLYYEIPIEGATNSHEYLVKRSSEVYNYERGTEDIDPLLDEITVLRQRILDMSEQMVELQTELAQNATN